MRNKHKAKYDRGSMRNRYEIISVNNFKECLSLSEILQTTNRRRQSKTRYTKHLNLKEYYVLFSVCDIFVGDRNFINFDERKKR